MKILIISIACLLSAASNGEEPAEHSLADAQARLNELGYAAGTADGIMGTATAKAIRNFQRVVSLPVTGEYNEKVALHLFHSCQAQMAPPKNGVQGGFQTSFSMQAAGGCHKPEPITNDEGENLYRVCMRASGDCSVPGPNGVTDSIVMTLPEPLE